MLMMYQLAKRTLISFIIIFIVQLLSISTVLQLHAETCEVGVVGPDGGRWEIIKKRSWNYPSNGDSWPSEKDFSCDLQGEGTLELENQSGDIYTYTLLKGEKRATEILDSCVNLGYVWSSWGNWPYDCQLCADARRVWPACLTDGSDLPYCGCDSCPVKCLDCGDNITFEYRTQNSCRWVAGTSIYFFCFSPAVTMRKLEQWVCNDCSTQYQEFKDSCGSNNITSWDNTTCTGICDNPQNIGPPSCQ